ncbi:MAG TPA: hypothetical protein VGA56_23615 [Opitutaceae bacterium]
MSEDESSLLGLGVDGSLLLWDVRTGARRVEPGLQQKSLEFEFALAPDGGELVVGGTDGTVRRMRVGHGPARPLVLPRSPPFMPAPFLPDPPARLLWLTGELASLLDVASGAPAGGAVRFPEPIQGITRGARGIAIRPDLRCMVVQTVAGEWQAWELDRSSVKRAVPLEGAPAGTGWVCFSREGDLVAMVAGELSDTVWIWDLLTGRSVGRPLRHGATIWVGNHRAACFSSDGRRFVTGGFGGFAIVWEVATGRPVLRLQTSGTYSLTHVDYSADGTRLATQSVRGEAQLWEAATGRPLSPVLWDTREGGGTTFSPSGDHLLKWSGDGIARVWDGRTGAAISEPMLHPGVAIRHAAFSPDERPVVTGAQDSTARIWDARTGQPITEPMKHASRVVGCAFSPDGRFVRTEEAGGKKRGTTFLVWPVPPETGDEPAPEWLLRLATICAAKIVNDAGQLVDVPEVLAGIDEIRRQLAALPDDDRFTEWGR